MTPCCEDKNTEQQYAALHKFCSVIHFSFAKFKFFHHIFTNLRASDAVLHKKMLKIPRFANLALNFHTASLQVCRISTKVTLKLTVLETLKHSSFAGLRVAHASLHTAGQTSRKSNTKRFTHSVCLACQMNFCFQKCASLNNPYMHDLFPIFPTQKGVKGHGSSDTELNWRR